MTPTRREVSIGLTLSSAAVLAQVSKDTPLFVVAGLKERELTFSSSVTLHKRYFGNLGGDGKAAGEVAKAGSHSLLVMDMYEHAYQTDYGAAAAKYIDASFENIRWEEVEPRFTRASKACRALEG